MATNNSVDSPLAGTTGTGKFVGSTSPSITTSLLDTNGAIWISQGTVASAVNGIAASNAATANSPVLAATGSDTNISLVLRGQGTSGAAILGVTDGSNAGSGFVGQVISSIITYASNTSYTNNTFVNLTSITLSAGDWDLWGNIGLTGTTVTALEGSISTTSATIGNNEFKLLALATSASSILAYPVPSTYMSVSGNTNVYLVIYGTGTGTMFMFGGIYARRRR
jgi:hypothetical protein